MHFKCTYLLTMALKHVINHILIVYIVLINAKYRKLKLSVPTLRPCVTERMSKGHHITGILYKVTWKVSLLLGGWG